MKQQIQQKLQIQNANIKKKGNKINNKQKKSQKKLIQQSIARHFQINKLKKQEKYDYMIKLIVVGDSGVGKTNIITSFCNPLFQYTDTHVPTIGVDFCSKIIHVENKKLKLQVWDTAGQERFRTITQTYYKGAAGILLVFSVGNRESFNNIKKWMESITEKTSESVKIVLIGNKIDLIDQQLNQNNKKTDHQQHNQQYQNRNNDLNSKKGQFTRVVSKKQGWDLAALYKIRYHQVSAKMNLKIDQIFYNIAQMINFQYQKQFQMKNSGHDTSFGIKHSKILVLNSQSGDGKIIKLKSNNGIFYQKQQQEQNQQQNKQKNLRTMKNCYC